MKHPDKSLITPLYVKSAPDMKWPEKETAFYMLTGEGLFLCRNTPFFRSSVEAPGWPGELAEHAEMAELSYPIIPQRQIETIIGFFARMGELHGCEAAAVFLWDEQEERMKFHIPRQVASVSESWGGQRYPTDLQYEMPEDLPGHLKVIGDIHSHVDAPAYASATDKLDETHRPGIHLVVGKIYREPPEMHCEFVVDGVRFDVDPAAVIEGYERRSSKVRQEWLEKVKVEVIRPTGQKSSSWWSSSKHDAWKQKDKPRSQKEDGGNGSEAEWTSDEPGFRGGGYS